MEARPCSFCGNPIEPGTGSMYVKRDGTIFHFCSSKCRKNLIQNRRVPRRVRWTRSYIKGGKAREEEAPAAAPTPKVKLKREPPAKMPTPPKEA